MFSVALDVLLRSVAICIIDQGGKVRLERSAPSEVPDPIRCLREFGEPIHQVGLEARQVNAALSAMRNKTDKHDARGIAVRDTIESDPALSHAMLPMLQARPVLFDTFTELDRRVRKAAHADPVCQRFLSTHAAYNTFFVQRHLISRPNLRRFRAEAHAT